MIKKDGQDGHQNLVGVLQAHPGLQVCATDAGVGAQLAQLLQRRCQIIGSAVEEHQHACSGYVRVDLDQCPANSGHILCILSSYCL